MKEKLLIVINTLDVGGAEVLVKEHIEYFITKYDVYLVTTMPYEQNFLSESLINSLGENRYTAFDFNSYKDTKNFRRLKCFINDIKPDVVISHLEFSNILISIISKTLGLIRHIGFEHVEQHHKYSVPRKIVKSFFYKRIDLIICVSEQIKYQIDNEIKICNTLVLDNFISDKYFTDTPNSSIQIRSNYGIDDKTKIILSIGRLTHQKNQYSLVLNLKDFLTESNSVLVLVGDGEDKRALEDLIIRHDLEERVIMLSSRDDIIDIIDICDVYVSYSLYEGFGLTIIEAMARRKVVLTTRTFGPDRYICDNVNGFLIDDSNLVDRLKFALSLSVEDRENVGLRAFNTASNYRKLRIMKTLESYLKCAE